MQQKPTITISTNATFGNIVFSGEEDINKAVALGLMNKNDCPIFIRIDKLELTHFPSNAIEKSCIGTITSIPLCSLYPNFNTDNLNIQNKITLQSKQQNIIVEFNDVPSQSIIDKINSFKNYPNYFTLAKDFLLKKNYLQKWPHDLFDLCYEHGPASPFYKQTIKTSEQTNLENQNTVHNNNKPNKWFSLYTILGFGIPITIFCFFLYYTLKRS